jgi:large subunit ribosomal protein L23
MGIFGSKKEKYVAEVATPKTQVKREPKKKMEVVSGASKGTVNPLILKSPRITEKATELAARNVYVFNVLPRANKHEVAKAIENVYGVIPERVRMLTIRGKKVSGRQGLGGKTAGGKKAYVFLKEGDTIDFV